MDPLDKARLDALLDRVSEDEDDFSYDTEKKSMFAIRACVELMIEWDVENAWDKLTDVKEHLCDDDIEDWLEKAMANINSDSLKKYVETLVKNNEAYQHEINRLQEVCTNLRRRANEADHLQLELSMLTQSLDAHKRQYAELQHASVREGERIKELVQQCDHKEATLRQMRTDFAAAVADRAVLNDQKRQTAAVLERQEQRIKELEADIKARDCRCDNQEQVITERDKEIAQLKERIHGLEHGNGMRSLD